MTLPLKHVAIIMDGNRRWADQRKLPRLSGHKEGVKSLKRLVRHAGSIGLEYLTVYAFSSENWQRSREEVRYLFELFSNVLRDEFDELSENRVRLRFIGDMSTIPARLKKSFERSMEESKHNTGLNLQVAINYGSRLEITQAAKRIAAEAAAGLLAPADITEELLNSYLFTGEIPDPEMMIRTGGEMRLSNYLLWQAAYSELYITPILWPDFTPENFDEAIEEYAQRNRRYGGD
ncbi:MAG: isoprenyl transferase [Candidatus Melainabacteria bacterium]|nr:isoprenyl transferase [Candidatus Melainabacteria bacterium]